MVATVLAIVGYVLMINATWTCNYFLTDGYVTYNSSEYFVVDTDGTQRGGVGLFSFQGVDDTGQYWYCYRYNEDQVQNSGFLDGPFKAASALGIISNICLGITMVLMIAIGCIALSPTAITFVGCLCLFGSLCSVLTFVAFASDLTKPPYNGTFFIGPGVAIAAALVSLATGVVVLKIPPASDADPFMGEPEPQPFQPGTVTVSETTMPDGTKKVTKTTVNPDGSQTVEETVITP